MYQTSQYISVQQSPLEYIAQSAVSLPSSGTLYALAAPIINDGLYSMVTSHSNAPNDPKYTHTELFQPYSRENQHQYIHSTPHQEYHFQPNHFLKPGKEGKFVGKAEDIREFVEEAFQLLFNEPFPDDIKISVLDAKQFHTLALHPSTIGVSINRRQHGLLSEILVKNDFLARVLLTVGHELGHVLTPTLSNPQNEEAKAYAFSLAWIEMIKKHNIAGLQDAIITENPAINGLHDVAFFFVEKLRRTGKKSWEIYQKIIEKKLKVSIF